MWEVKFTGKAEKQFSKLPRNIKENIAKAIREKKPTDLTGNSSLLEKN